MKRTGLFFLSILYVLSLSVQAQEPKKNSAIAEATTISSKISYQGILADNDGNPLEGSFTMKFALYVLEAGGESIWNETQSPVLVEKGVFHVLLGESNSLGTISFDKPYWLEITVNDELLSPRIEFSSSAYSFNTARIQGQPVSSVTPEEGQVLKWDGTEWLPTNDEKIDSSGLGEANGDVSGVFSDLTVVGIQQKAISVENPNDGDVLTWTGSHWEPEEAEPRGRAGGDLRGDYPDPEVDGLRGNPVSSHAPEDGEVLTWSGSNWRPEPVELTLPFDEYVSTGSYGFRVVNTNTGGGTGINGQGDWGISGFSAASTGRGVYGSATSSSGTNYGVYGNTNSTNGSGVYGVGVDKGVHGVGRLGVVGEAQLSNSAGLVGYSNSSGGTTYGVFGSQNSSASGARAGLFNGNLEYTGSLIGPSDEKLKKNIQPIGSTLAKIAKLQTHTFIYREDVQLKKLALPEGIQYGFVAQELENVFPELVVDSYIPCLDQVACESRSELVNYKGVKYLEMIPILVQAIKEQQGVIEMLLSEVSQLKSND